VLSTMLPVLRPNERDAVPEQHMKLITASSSSGKALLLLLLSLPLPRFCLTHSFDAFMRFQFHCQGCAFWSGFKDDKLETSLEWIEPLIKNRFWPQFELYHKQQIWHQLDWTCLNFHVNKGTALQCRECNDNRPTNLVSLFLVLPFCSALRD
jgi:hypothetical protein